jgi:hypothetical protein
MQLPNDRLAALQDTLRQLEADPEQTPAVSDLRRILLQKIVALEAE